jgi:hypothetical protein
VKNTNKMVSSMNKPIVKRHGHKSTYPEQGEAKSREKTMPAIAKWQIRIAACGLALIDNTAKVSLRFN